MLKKLVLSFVAATVVAGTLLTPTPAKAWWEREGWRGPAYYRPRVLVVRPLYPVRVVRPWIRPHYNRFGYFVPGHFG